MKPSRALFFIAFVWSVTPGGCRTPTSVTVHVLTDVPCAEVRGAIVAAAAPEEYENIPATARSQRCTPLGDGRFDLGTVVLVPRSDGEARMGIRAVLGLGRDAEACTPPTYEGCIVARRRLNYLEHDGFNVQIFLARDCAGLACDVTTTCYNKTCRGNELDPRACAPNCDSDVIGEPCDTPGTVTCTGGMRKTCGPNRKFTSEPCGLACSETKCVAATDLFTTGQGGAPDATCALVAGDMYCWGANLVPDGKPASPLPVKVEGLPKLVQLGSTPTSESPLALDIDGNAWCFGKNDTAQCGLPRSTATTLPRNLGVKDVAQVVSSSIATCLRLKDGSVQCVGSNTQAQLGRGGASSATDMIAPVLTTGWSGRATDLACTSNSCCLIDDTGAVACWGSNLFGQLGTGDAAGNNGTPAKVNLPAGARRLFGGDNGMCVALVDGRAACFGWSRYDLFIAPMTDQRTPLLLQGVSSVAGLAVGQPMGHYAWTSQGAVTGWGTDGLVKGALAPVPALAGATKIAIAGRHACALIAGGVQCWGENATGALGDGTTTAHATPAPIVWP